MSQYSWRKVTFVKLQHCHSSKRRSYCNILTTIKLQFSGQVQTCELYRRHIWYGRRWYLVKVGSLGHDQLSSRPLWKDMKWDIHRKLLKEPLLSSQATAARSGLGDVWLQVQARDLWFCWPDRRLPSEALWGSCLVDVLLAAWGYPVFEEWTLS